MSATLCFLDTETTGLAWDSEVWEFACIARRPGEEDVEHQFLIEHDRRQAPLLPEPFLSDYRRRYDHDAAQPRGGAAHRIAALTSGATIVGAVPGFDTERLGLLLRQYGMEPAWRSHLCDVECLAAGYLLGKGNARDREIALPPWDSEALSLAVGVDPDHFTRHTALGDARWVRAIYDAVTA